MSGKSFLRVPVNPRLEFGVPLKEVCKNELLHPGLRELFLKAYINAVGEEYAHNEEQDDEKSKGSHVLEALKAGPKGQGSVADRFLLKSKLESGKWIIATQTPLGAPLWLIRHFLGLLPQPLLHDSHWEMIAIACGVSSSLNSENYTFRILKKIFAGLKALPIENYLTLEALVLLLRNLSTMQTRINASPMLNREVIDALSQYFTAAIFSRPYRPGLHTMLDEAQKPLLVFLAEHWHEVKEFCRHSGIPRYHNSNCQFQYEFVNPDNEVGFAKWRASDAEDIMDEKIDPSKSSVRQSDQRLSETKNTRSYNPFNNSENDKQETKTPDVFLAPKTQESKTDNESRNVPVAIRTPEGVYFIPENNKSSSTSLTINNRPSSKNKEKDFCKVFLLLRSDMVPLDVKENGLQFQGGVLEGKTNGNINLCDVQELVFKYDYEGTAINGTSQASGVKSSKRKVAVKDKVKVNGTQTFECEFPEEIFFTGNAEIEKSELLPLRVKITEDLNDVKEKRKGDDTLVVTGTRRSSVFKLSKKLDEKRAVIPLTKSTAMLIKNFANFDERIIYLTTRKDVSKSNSVIRISDLPKVGNGKLIDAVERLIKSQRNNQRFSLKVDKLDVKTLTNPSKEVNKERDQKKHSDNDLIYELQNKLQASL